MKVGIFVTQYEPGGAQKAAINLANGLCKKGYEIDLVFLYFKKEFDIYINPDVKVSYLVNSTSLISKIFGVLFALVKLFMTRKYCVAIAFTHYSNLYVSFVSKLFSIPCVISHRNPRTSYSKLVSILDSVFYKLNFYGAVTYVSESTRDSFNYSQDGEKHYVIYNTVDVSKIRETDLFVGRKYLLAVGRLVKQKNHELLIKAFHESSYNGDLIIIGSGPLKKHLVDVDSGYSKSNKNVIFIDSLDNSAILGLISRADAFLMPSLYEGMSNALLEALALGAFVMVSDAQAQIEAIRASKVDNYFIGRVNDVGEWAKELDSLAEVGFKKNEPSKVFDFENFTSNFERVVLNVKY